MRAYLVLAVLAIAVCIAALAVAAQPPLCSGTALFTPQNGGATTC